MELDTPVQVAIANHGIQRSPRLVLHLHDGEHPICHQSWPYEHHVVMPAGEYAESDMACHVCCRSLSSKIDIDVEFGGYEEELASPFGRPAAEILVDDGLVEVAAKKFDSSYPDVVAGLAQVPLADVLRLFDERWSSISASVICTSCGHRNRFIGKWPRVQGVKMCCSECDHVGMYDFEEYIPGLGQSQELLESLSDATSYGSNLVDVVDHDVDLMGIVADGLDDLWTFSVNCSDDGIKLHRVVDGEPVCGYRQTAYNTIEANYVDAGIVCGNCMRIEVEQ